MFAIGQVVFSRQGRDRNKAFIVVKTEGDYLYLADGRIRPFLRAKKKKIKHVQPTYHVDYALAEKIREGAYLNDADFRKALEDFM